MRAKNHPFQLLAAMLLVLSLQLSGCSTVKPAKAPARAPAAPTAMIPAGSQFATLQKVQDDYYNAELQTQVTEDALNELVLSPACDLSQAYQVFLANAERMGWDGNLLLKHADGLRFEGRAYLVESGQIPTTCPLPGLRLPPDRKAAQLGMYFDAVADEGWEVKRAYREFEFDLYAIKHHLDQYLTPAGVDTIRFLIRKAQVDAESLKSELEQAQDAIDRAIVAKQAMKGV